MLDKLGSRIIMLGNCDVHNNPIWSGEVSTHVTRSLRVDLGQGIKGLSGQIQRDLRKMIVSELYRTRINAD